MFRRSKTQCLTFFILVYSEKMLIAQKTKKTTHAYNHKLPYTPSVKLKIIPVNKSMKRLADIDYCSVIYYKNKKVGTE